MSRTVRQLVADYLSRTIGVWLILVIVQTMQISVLWACQREAAPLIGAVVGALIFFARFSASDALMSTLPISPHELALVRRWAAVGLPALAICASVLLAWCANVGWGWAVPPLSLIVARVMASIGVLPLFSWLPLPRLGSLRSSLRQFVVLWGALIICALWAGQVEWPAGPLALALVGTGVAMLSSRLARARLAAPAGPQASHDERLRGVNLLFEQILRATLLLGVSATVLVSLVRWLVPGLESPSLEPVLPIVFVSVVGICAHLVARPWLGILNSLRCLPVSTSCVAFLVCVVLMGPGLVTCGIATLVHAFVSDWGLRIPAYLLPLFGLVPALLVPWRRLESSSVLPAGIAGWAGSLRLLTWPLWTVSFGSLALTKLLPPWSGPFAWLVVVLFALGTYSVAIRRIRAGQSVG